MAATDASNIACGLITIDGSQAILGFTSGQGQFAQQVARVTSSTASRTRRGGSSAPRFARKRDGQELAFLRRVVEKLQLKLSHVDALIVGGKAGMKRKLLKEMPLSLRSRVQRVVKFSGDSDADALRALARHWSVVQQQTKLHDTLDCLHEFLNLTNQPTQEFCCYGEAQTRLALQMGAVDRLLLTACDGNRGEDLLQTLARTTRAKVVRIRPDTEDGAAFCGGFGVGGLLRWPLDLDDPEPYESGAESVWCLEDEADAVSDASTADIVGDSLAQSAAVWLAARLTRSLDVSTAEALAAGVEVLLAFEDELIEDRVIQAVELLREQGVEEFVLDEFIHEVYT